MYRVIRLIFLFAFIHFKLNGQIDIRHGGTTTKTLLDTALCSASAFNLEAFATNSAAYTYQWSIPTSANVALSNATSPIVGISTTAPLSTITSVLVTLSATPTSGSPVIVQTITLILFPNLSFVFPANYCSNNPASLLIATPAGGVFRSGIQGLVDSTTGTFNPSAGQPTGTFSVTYKLSHTGPSGEVRTCATTKSTTITSVPTAT